jgi:hypothetical protein
MNDKLHSAAFIKEALGDDGRLRWKRSQSGSAGADVQSGLFRATPVKIAFVHQPFDRVVLQRDSFSDASYFFRQFDRTPWSFTAPEGN